MLENIRQGGVVGGGKYINENVVAKMTKKLSNWGITLGQITNK